ncbi:MAG: flagellar export chaperone FliS [Deferrisomatales bacterium]
MTYGRGAQAYTQTQVSTTTNQQRLIVMAYDGILKFLSQAKVHLANGELEAAETQWGRARAVVEELAGSLNQEAGGQIARNLWNLYVFFAQKITEANLRKLSAPADEIVPVVRKLRDAWVQLEVPADDAQAQALNRRMPGPEQAHSLSVTG